MKFADPDTIPSGHSSLHWNSHTRTQSPPDTIPFNLTIKTGQNLPRAQCLSPKFPDPDKSHLDKIPTLKCADLDKIVSRNNRLDLKSQTRTQFLSPKVADPDKVLSEHNPLDLNSQTRTQLSLKVADPNKILPGHNFLYFNSQTRTQYFLLKVTDPDKFLSGHNPLDLNSQTRTQSRSCFRRPQDSLPTC